MLRNVTHLLALAAFTAGALAVAGCTTATKPYGLTGDTGTTQVRDQARWTDGKGKYHAEWRAGINRPAVYPREVADAR
jgi:hypothetical protein